MKLEQMPLTFQRWLAIRIYLLSGEIIGEINSCFAYFEERGIVVEHSDDHHTYTYQRVNKLDEPDKWLLVGESSNEDKIEVSDL